MSFDKLVGNDKIKGLLNELVEQNHIVHSYLFTGIEGIGKKIFAQEFARKILCIEKEKNEKCLSCIKWNSRNHPDFIQIDKDGNVIKIEQIRNMQKEILQKPIVSNKKVYIINDSDAMTEEAQNCLLKTLEEPPEFAVIILITNNENALLNTIKSRCMKINFLPIEKQGIKQYIEDNLNIEKEEDLIEKCEGSLGKAIYMHEQKELYNKVNILLRNIKEQSLIELFNNADVLYKEKENIIEILDYINISLYHTKDIKMLNCIKYVEETKKRLLANGNYDMCIDYLLIKIWEEINEKYSRNSI